MAMERFLVFSYKWWSLLNPYHFIIKTICFSKYLYNHQTITSHFSETPDDILRKTAGLSIGNESSKVNQLDFEIVRNISKVYFKVSFQSLLWSFTQDKWSLYWDFPEEQSSNQNLSDEWDSCWNPRKLGFIRLMLVSRLKNNFRTVIIMKTPHYFCKSCQLIIISFIEETFSRTCGFRKGAQRLILINRTKNSNHIKRGSWEYGVS